MARPGLFLLLIFTVVICNPIPKSDYVASEDFLKKQIRTMLLFFHVEEPNHVERCKNISATWNFEDNINNFNDKTAVQRWVSLWTNNWLLPRHVPFSALESSHLNEVRTLFSVLYSAKDYETFYKAAVFVRDRVNEDLFVYVLTAVVMHRSDMQGFFIPPIYEVLSEYFNNGEVLNIAQKINVHGESALKDYPSVFKWDDNFVIRWNYTAWPYYSKSAPMSYFTEDQGLNQFYYYFNFGYLSWLGGDVVPLAKDRRGEWFWFIHKQLLNRYYLERLSNRLEEIEDIGNEVVEEGYSSGLVYPNGIPFPVRPNYFHLNQPAFVDKLSKIQDYERRIRDAIEKGFFVNSNGKLVDIRSPESIDVLGNLIEANVDSPNVRYYKDFISMWKSVLGNSVTREPWNEGAVSMVVPSVLEHYQTALRDPAFFMIWKRVLNLFSLWQEKLPHYTKEELTCPSVVIMKVDIDKLLTYFEHYNMNITAILPMSKEEKKWNCDKISVFVQYPRLNHKDFNIRIYVHSEVAKKVTVRLYMAPKHDSRGRLIPLKENWKNFFLWDQFVHDLPKGDSVVNCLSSNNKHVAKAWNRAEDVYQDAIKAVESGKKYYFDELPRRHLLPQHLLLPKGRVEGMEFVVAAFISEYRPPKVPQASTFDPVMSDGFGSGSRKLTDDPLGFPFDRPWAVWPKDVPNIYIQSVPIYHKPAPEIVVPYNV